MLAVLARCESSGACEANLRMQREDPAAWRAMVEAKMPEPMDDTARSTLATSNTSLSCTEAARNFFFREGDAEHTFEAGRRQVSEWRRLSEDTVLIERVAGKLKPVASLVEANIPGGLLLDGIRDEYELTIAVGTNEWEASVLSVDPSVYARRTAIGELAQAHGRARAGGDGPGILWTPRILRTIY